MNKSQKVVSCLVLLVILIIAWGLFPLFFKWLMIGIGSNETALKDFGAFGDIYGSLNTLFTSATLIIVVYSAYLQRQANQDARQAMDKQLEQAREDTEKQLRQAREATQQQIEHAKLLADMQLVQVKQSSAEQLGLAQASHDSQIYETKYSIFINTFNSLMALKQSRYHSLKFVDGEKSLTGETAIRLIGFRFFELFNNEWSNIHTLSREAIRKEYDRYVIEIVGTNYGFNEITDYFRIYGDISNLINRSILNEADKDFFRKIVNNSMTVYERITILWVSVVSYSIDEALTDSYLIRDFYLPQLLPFFYKFYKKTYFGEEALHMYWDVLNRQTPT